jgi:predicted nucleotidyltransferase
VGALVDFERPTHDNLLGLSKDLERLFGRKMDILTPPGLESIRVRGIAESIRKTLAYV